MTSGRDSNSVSLAQAWCSHNYKTIEHKLKTHSRKIWEAKRKHLGWRLLVKKFLIDRQTKCYQENLKRSSHYWPFIKWCQATSITDHQHMIHRMPEPKICFLSTVHFQWSSANLKHATQFISLHQSARVTTSECTSSHASISVYSFQKCARVDVWAACTTRTAPI